MKNHITTLNTKKTIDMIVKVLVLEMIDMEMVSYYKNIINDLVEPRKIDKVILRKITDNELSLGNLKTSYYMGIDKIVIDNTDIRLAEIDEDDEISIEHLSVNVRKKLTKLIEKRNANVRVSEIKFVRMLFKNLHISFSNVRGFDGRGFDGRVYVVKKLHNSNLFLFRRNRKNSYSL